MISELISELKEVGIKLHLSEDGLGVSDPNSSFTSDLRKRVLAAKPALIEFIRAVSNSEEIKALPRSKNGCEAIAVAPQQKRLFAIQEASKDSIAYNMSAAYLIKGDLNRERVQWAFEKLVERHDSLRSHFAYEDGGVVQVIRTSNKYDFTYLESFDGDIVEALRASVKPFDLMVGPLLRVKLFKRRTDHVLFIDIHHIIGDLSSLQIMISDFSNLYVGAPIEEKKVQFADYLYWLVGDFGKRYFERQSEYWSRQFSERIPVMDLPLSRQRTSDLTFDGGLLATTFSAALSSEIDKFSRERKLTPFIVFLAVLKVFLSKYCRQNDIIIGTPVLGRRIRGLEGLVGMLVNTLAIRSQPEESKVFADYLLELKEIRAGALQNQDFPFDELVDRFCPNRDRSRNPIFDVQFSFVEESLNLRSSDIDDLDVAPVEFSRSRAKFDLSFEIGRIDVAYQLRIEYRRDLFGQGSIQRMANNFVTLVESALSSPGSEISCYSILSETERKTILNTFNHAETVYPHKRIDELFEKQVRQFPSAVAVVLGKERLTYRQLNDRSSRLARTLREDHGVGPDVIVGLCLERSIEMIVGIMGIIKAGGAYLPIDPEYPLERIGLMLADSGSETLLIRGEKPDDLSFEGRVVDLLSEESYKDDGEPVESFGSPSDLLYIIYTSGSTGKPKGVGIEHGNVSRLFSACDSWFNFDENDVWTLFHYFGFDFSVWEIFGALLHGGRLVIVPYWISRSPKDFYDLLVAEEITVLSQTPSAFGLLVAEDGERVSADSELSLRHVVFGGEALKYETLRPWLSRRGEDRPILTNMYGITETTVHVTFKRIKESDLSGRVGSSVGIPITDLRAYVLWGERKLQPIGVPGELHVSGAGLARGYLNRPDLTGERFVKSPYDTHGLMYRTGDLARWLEDGSLEYLGRIDDQVKIRGHRIELGEVESALSSVEGVSQSVCTALKNAKDEWYLCGYWTGEKALSESSVRRDLLEALPLYMVPTHLIKLSEFPLNLNGKVDRKALPDPSSKSCSDSEYVAPRNAREESLCSIWGEVLGIERVSIEDSFFELGGDSIRAIQVVSKASELGLVISVEKLFRYSTVRSLVESIANERGEIALSESSVTPFALISESDRKLIAPEIEDAYPLTRLQLGMVYHSLSSETSDGVYHDLFSYELGIRFDRPAMERSLDWLVSKHPVLRTSFALRGFEEILQLVHAEVAPSFEVFDWIDLGEDDWEEGIKKFLESERRRDFDFNQAPLIRFFVHLKTREKFQFSVSFHHSILDGWSIASLNASLFRTYVSELNGESIPVESTTSFGIYVSMERAAIERETSRDYWSAIVEGKEFAALPKMLTIDSKADETRSLARVISPQIYNGLTELSSQLGIPLKSILLAAHVRTVSLLCGGCDGLTGLVSSGRPEVAGGEGLLGLFLNTLPFPLKHQALSWEDLAKQVFRSELESMEHRQFPLSEIQSLSKGRVLFEIVFNYIHFHVLDSVDEDLRIQTNTENGYFFERTNYPLTCQFVHRIAGQGLILSLVRNESKVDSGQADRIASYFLKALEQLAFSPDSLVHGICLLSDSEKHQLLREFNATDVSYQKDLLIHELFEEQVCKTPDAVAALFGKEKLKYRELDERSNRLAWKLREEYGVGPDALVGLCLERSLEMLVGMLGILKAGGAYLPIDPTIPEERKDYILQDSKVETVLVKGGDPLRDVFEGRSLDLDSPGSYTERVDSPTRMNSSSGLAYCIYTSGSTGKPKGCLIEHQSLVNYISCANDNYCDKETPVFPWYTSLSFDLTVTSTFVPITNGGCLCIFPEREVFDLLRDVLAEDVLNIIKVTPAHLQAMVSLDCSQSNIRKFIVGGEELSSELAKAVCEQFGDVEIYNEYGPTEATVGCMIYRFDQNFDIGRTVSIGKPSANSRIYILGDYDRPSSFGVSGELCIGGTQLARGYLNRYELTAEKFVENPFLVGERMYRTGDLACWLPNGNIEFLGRVDNQVKIRGFRIEPGEVEAALKRIDGVDQAVVLASMGLNGANTLRAYLVSSNDDISVESLRDSLMSELPEYMVPSEFHLMDVVPLTRNGKLDRRVLLDTENRIRTGVEFVPPQNRIQELIANIWKDVLNLDPVGIKDEFFSIGGDSIKALAVNAKLSNQLERSIPLAKHFELGTIKAFSEYLEADPEDEVLTKSKSKKQTEERLERAKDLKRRSMLRQRVAQI